MAGHSQNGQTFQHRKKPVFRIGCRAKLFFEDVQESHVAAKMGDPDPKRPTLRLGVKEAKRNPAPRDVIERQPSKKAIGGEGRQLRGNPYEALWPRMAWRIIVRRWTDKRKNRTASNVRSTFTKKRRANLGEDRVWLAS